MLTKRQSDLLAFIHTRNTKHGHAPSYEEMCAGIGLASKSGIHSLLRGLRARGFVEWQPGCPRAITVLRTHDQSAREAALAAALKRIEDMPILWIVEDPDRPRRMARDTLAAVLGTAMRRAA